MNIVLVINKPFREQRIMEAIKTEILSRQPEAQVFFLEHRTWNFVQLMLQFRPDVILTFPFTGEGLSARYYLFKLRFKCRILCLRTEGVIDLSFSYNIEWATGFDRYGSKLVDYELFWGKQMAEAVGPSLVKQRKLTGLERVKVVGYPRLESYFKKQAAYDSTSSLPDRVKSVMETVPRERRVLFATGFHLANYTEEDLFAAGDLNAKQNLMELLEAIEKTKIYRQQWIAAVLAAATRFPDFLFILKKHPIEKREDYEELSLIHNVLFIYEDMDINEVVPLVSLFIHYGSTSLVDAYLSGVPAVYVYSPRNNPWYSDLGWPSSRRVNIEDLGLTIEEHHSNRIQFFMTDHMKRVLTEVFDITEGQPYTPVARIVDLLLKDEPAQRIPLTDVYLWKSLFGQFFLHIRIGIVQLAKRVFGVATESRLLPGLKAKFTRTRIH